ncbi:uncharacterized protein LOC111408560 [Olea europaea var. sylvestris]|uniref:uncharacterized protein LOC111408560 n=1 Tax=Olea europaea var. sylvestris TaxID=158386 RepID=UPI000C1D3AEB|nr:uncharacterized protein LOC111408560 [Olea europaea var. sylvestris]
MILDHQLTPTITPLYGFTEDSITPKGKITLAVEMGESPRTTTNFMEFLIVDSRSAYHGVLGRPALKELGAAEPRDIHVVIADVVMADVLGDALTEQEDVDMIDAPPNAEVLVIDEIDPRIMEHEPQASPVKELESFSVDPRDPSKVLKVGKCLANILKEKIKDFLSKNLDVFAWKYEDMVGIDPKVSCHHLKIDPKVAPHRQKRRALNPERYEALKEEVQKLIQNGFIRKATYPRWVSNPILVRKNNGKWRVCIDFTNLNRACPKDSFPLLRIDQLVDSTTGHELLSFMDAKTMEVYVNDMLVKSLEAEDHIKHLNSTFQILRRYRMRLNPHKCAFGVASGKFLGYTVNQRGIEANPEKIEALCKMRSPQKSKEVQSLTGRWTEECEEAFQCLKKHLGQAPLLSKPKPNDILQLYLAVSNEAISSVLIRKEGSTQLPVYYTSKALLSPETCYPGMEKLALVLQKPDASGKLLKWAVELSEFDLVFKARAAIKGQALADFVAEFANLPEVDEIMEPIEPPTWNLFIDGSAGEVGSRARVVLISPEGHKLTSAVRFGFKATNNVAEYEALLAGLRLATEMQIPRIENAHVDALSKLASSKDSELLTVVPIEYLLLPSIEAPTVMWVVGTPAWMQPIVAYLKDQCVGGEKATYILREVHEGGYYWPTLKQDALEFVRKCDKCERFSPVQRQPSQELTTVSSPWPFSKWGVDLIGSLPKSRGGASFAIVAIDYFTKWVEAEPLEKITEANNSKARHKEALLHTSPPTSKRPSRGREQDD